ncbi:MAG: WecB/TagA/CpsF family glycosyltransferase [Spirochaeta sp.]
MGNAMITEIMLAGTRVHHLESDQIMPVIQELSSKAGSQRIVFLSTYDLVRAWFSRRKRAQLESAALVLPVQKGIQRAAVIAGRTIPARHMPFQLIIQVLGAIEAQQGSLYIVGGRPYALEKAEANLKYTFPKVRVVGRFPGYFRKGVENSLLTAARKSSPDVLLVGTGVSGGDKWLVKHTDSLPSGIAVSAPQVFRVFTEQRRRPSRFLFNSGLKDSLKVLLPWHWLRIPFYCILVCRLLIDRIRRR